MLTFFILVGILIISFYIYQNLLLENYIISVAQVMVISILMISYFLFPIYINMEILFYVILSSITFLMLLVLVIPAKDPEVSLFWLASLPAFTFYFLGIKKGIKWSLYTCMILFFITLFSFMETFVYTPTLVLQIFIAYVVISYLHFMIESDRQNYEEKLSVALKENKMLFSEVHHRTKNNMQIIMGLLETQSFKIDNPKYKKMFENHVDRLKAMSLMHKNLYSNDGYEQVNIKNYLNEIADNLQIYTEHSILLEVEGLELDMKIAMNIGLIFNEAVANSIEHAFSDEIGEIKIVLRRALGIKCLFFINDDGIGFDVTKSYQSLGLTLIEDLSLSLPNGKLNIVGNDGSQIKISFDL